MDLIECGCDITDILQNSDFTVLRKLRLTCHEFRMKVASKLQNATTYTIECLKQNTANFERISSLQQQIETLKAAVDSTKLQQKIIDKKMANATKKEDILKKDIEEAQTCRDNLSLELVDLQQEIEDRKKKKKQKWDAYKRACYVYKQNLDMDIQLEDEIEAGGYEKVKVLYFVTNEALEGKFYVNLLHKDDIWKVGEIQPLLEENHKKYLQNSLHIHGQSTISDITGLLCCLRDIFLKYYIKLR